VELVHFAIAICSNNKMIVAAGRYPLSAFRSFRSIKGRWTAFKPLGTVNRILMGYFPDFDFRWWQ
jgi:hypothetical protein